MSEMKNVYQARKSISLLQKKEYLLKIVRVRQEKALIVKCLTIHDLNLLLSDSYVNMQFYTYAYHMLLASTNFDELEYHLMMMNSLFQYQSYEYLKEDLYHKLCLRKITSVEYGVIRYIIPFENMSFEEIMNKLYIDYHVDPLECAKICMIEEHYHMAYQFLKLLDYCDNEALLKLLCSYSLCDYIGLMRHYAKKQPHYQLALEG